MFRVKVFIVSIVAALSIALFPTAVSAAPLPTVTAYAPFCENGRASGMGLYGISGGSAYIYARSLLQVYDSDVNRWINVDLETNTSWYTTSTARTFTAHGTGAAGTYRTIATATSKSSTGTVYGTVQRVSGTRTINC